MSSERPLVLHTEDTSAPCAIRFEQVSKVYRLFESERKRFLAAFSKRVPFEEVRANDCLSFEICRGEAVAFIGRNGAGKSTALKMVTGVAYPTSGTIEVNGRVSALLELSAGFDAQLTGIENLRMRARLWGLTKEQVDDLLPRVIEFAELGTFIKQPLRTYSSGMRARLGFALAVNIEPDIFVVDEALSVGDKRFAEKCLERVHEIISDSKVTVLFVTHSSSSAQEFCRRGIVLASGKAVFDGPIDAAIEHYDTRE
ncbi:MAG: ABC transporter ATP-binding protein [Coriobacteriales bacterium]|jgi:teichoic acid transport system ATP-binding protein|nr:ABC transporter ATP-binding protein [Coriobacteriales bacterium]